MRYHKFGLKPAFLNFLSVKIGVLAVRKVPSMAILYLSKIALDKIISVNFEENSAVHSAIFSLSRAQICMKYG